MPHAVDIITAARKAKGLTQTQVGKYLGVPKQTVSKWENGKRKLTLDEAVVLAKVLDVHPSQLFDDNIVPQTDQAV